MNTYSWVNTGYKSFSKNIVEKAQGLRVRFFRQRFGQLQDSIQIGIRSINGFVALFHFPQFYFPANSSVPLRRKEMAAAAPMRFAKHRAPHRHQLCVEATSTERCSRRWGLSVSLLSYRLCTFVGEASIGGEKQTEEDDRYRSASPVTATFQIDFFIPCSYFQIFLLLPRRFPLATATLR